MASRKRIKKKARKKIKPNRRRKPGQRKKKTGKKVRVEPKHFKADQIAAKALQLKKDLIATGGDMSKAAHRTGISRSMAYSYVRQFGLWVVVNEARRARYERLSVGDSLLSRSILSMRG